MGVLGDFDVEALDESSWPAFAKSMFVLLMSAGALEPTTERERRDITLTRHPVIHSRFISIRVGFGILAYGGHSECRAEIRWKRSIKKLAEHVAEERDLPVCQRIAVADESENQASCHSREEALLLCW